MYDFLYRLSIVTFAPGSTVATIHNLTETTTDDGRNTVPIARLLVRSAKKITVSVFRKVLHSEPAISIHTLLFNSGGSSYSDRRYSDRHYSDKHYSDKHYSDSSYSDMLLSMTEFYA